MVNLPTFPEKPPVSVMIIKAIHGGYLVMSMEVPQGRPLFCSDTIDECTDWVSVAMAEEDENEQMVKQHFSSFPDMGSVGPTDSHMGNPGCIKLGCTSKDGIDCKALDCPYNFRRPKTPPPAKDD